MNALVLCSSLFHIIYPGLLKLFSFLSQSPPHCDQLKNKQLSNLKEVFYP